MKNKKIRGWIILILIVIAGIIALLVALKRNKKESFDQVTNADGAIVKENVQVINEENAPDQVTENALVYISNNPKYKKGDVLVSGIIDGADAGFIRRVTNVSKKNDVYVYETEPALLTDVFEEAHIIRRFQLTEEGVEEDDFSENKNDIINNSSFQNSTYSVIQLTEEDSNSGIKYKQSLIDDYEFDLTPEEDNGDEDEDDEDWISVSSKGGLSVWEEITVEIEDGDIKCGISLQSKAEASIVAKYNLEEEKEFEKTIFSKNLPNYQFLVAGWIPMVVTNEVAGVDIWDYMGNKLLDVRKKIDMLFLGENLMKEKLTRIVDETEQFVRSCERPGVVKRWKKMNPDIIFFDCAFELLENNPDMYKEISLGLTDLHLACYPDDALVEKRNKYFAEAKRKIENGNFQYSEDRVFQNELLRTLTLVFENDFKGYL